MSSPTLVHVIPYAELIIMVFCNDGTGKPRASWFDTGSADRATEAADPMKMRVVTVETEEQKALAPHLAR